MNNVKRRISFGLAVVSLLLVFYGLMPFLTRGMVALSYVDASQESLRNPGERTSATTVDARPCQPASRTHAPNVGSLYCPTDTPGFVKGIRVVGMEYYLQSNYSRDDHGLFWRMLYLKLHGVSFRFAATTDRYNGAQDPRLSVGLYIAEGAPSFAPLICLEEWLWRLGF